MLIDFNDMKERVFTNMNGGEGNLNAGSMSFLPVRIEPRYF